jgi:hypothetical protein
VAAAGVLQAALEAIELVPDADRGPEPGAPFMAMVERAEKVAPIRADTSLLTPGELLQMIGGVAEAPAPDVSGLAEEGEAALGRLAAAAWDVIRMGAAEDDPKLRTCLVEICNHLGGKDPRRRRDD